MATDPSGRATLPPALSLAGQVALVTGASRGIGRAIALALAEAGAAVACAARALPDLEATAAAIREEGGQAYPVPLDITSTEAIAAAVGQVQEALGPVTILVNNAGITLERRTEELTDGEWDHVLATNLTSMFRCARAVAPGMLARGRGKIVNVGSMWGRVGVPRYAAYCVAKAGVEALTRCLAAEWSRHGVHVHCLAPGYVATDFNRALMAQERARADILRRIPLGRIAQPEEVGALAVYLASPAADFLSGQTVCLDGGQTVAG